MPAITKFLKPADEVMGGIQMFSIKEHRFPFLPKIAAWNRFNKNSGGTLVEKCCHFSKKMKKRDLRHGNHHHASDIDRILTWDAISACWRAERRRYDVEGAD